jgi:hypothetical protein
MIRADEREVVEFVRAAPAEPLDVVHVAEVAPVPVLRIPRADLAAAVVELLQLVAGTRAMDELVICRCMPTEAKSPWRSFHPELERATVLDITRSEPVERPVLDRGASALMREVELAVVARRRASIAALGVSRH